ncbi:hypothetical protein ACQ4WX_29560 [Streptomyces lasalocidi]
MAEADSAEEAEAEADAVAEAESEGEPLSPAVALLWSEGELLAPVSSSGRALAGWPGCSRTTRSSARRRTRRGRKAGRSEL